MEWSTELNKPPITEAKPNDSVPSDVTSPLPSTPTKFDSLNAISSATKADESTAKEKRSLTHRVEAVGLVFLCCPYVKIRYVTIKF